MAEEIDGMPIRDRAPEGEGVRAPMAGDLGHAQHSVFDGKGNETVVVTVSDEDGRTKQGTGPTAEKAMKDAKGKKGADPIGEGMGPAAKPSSS
jgi:hypothetical protein